MLGFVSERVPRSGALGLALMGGAGMGIVGLVTSPWLGKIADQTSHERFVAEQPAVVSTLESASAALRRSFPRCRRRRRRPTCRRAIDATNKVVTAGKSGTLPPIETANAMRSVTGLGDARIPRSRTCANLLGPAENFGGRTSFRRLVPFAAVAAVIFAAPLGERPEPRRLSRAADQPGRSGAAAGGSRGRGALSARTARAFVGEFVSW